MAARTEARSLASVPPRSPAGECRTCVAYAHGHVEIARGDGTACSDFCGTMADCTAQAFMPVK